ncbi:MAG TPA: hemerythrin domain-containing protein [Candidatus Binatia bacterium]|nr:hemerythrin domain-containing protein [Candidatus Binatia bacterium]
MIQIGAPLAHDFSDPLSVLSDCHRRIEHFLSVLVTVTRQSRGGALDSEQRDALQVSLRYFAEAEPMHTADEEESLFPRLRAAHHAQAPAAIAIANRLTDEHRNVRAHHDRVAALVRRWLDDDSLPSDAIGDLAKDLDALAAIYRRHIPTEDEELLALARGILSAGDVAIIGREMAARRGVTPSPGPVYRLLADDHVRLDALLRQAVAKPGEIDRAAYAEFRKGLLKHIGMEEKILLPAAQKARGGEPLPIAGKLRLDHGALAALLVPTPTLQIVGTIRTILTAHNAVEEGPGGVYCECERLVGNDLDALLAGLRAAPEVPVHPHVDGELVVNATRRAVARAGYDPDALHL